MDQTDRAVPHRRPRRGVMSHMDGLPAYFQDSRMSSLDLPCETQACDQESKSSGWPRIYAMPNVILLQAVSLLRFGSFGTRSSGSCLRTIAAWFVFLYLGFSVISFRPQAVYSKLQGWRYSNTIPQYGIWALFPGSQPPALGIMETSLAFSKLSPHLGNLAPGTLQPMLDPDAESQMSDPSITTCIWIPSTHLDILSSWTDLFGCQISVLVTSNYTPNSPGHQRLVKEIQELIKPKTHLRGSVVLLSTPFDPPSPNTYINLARLFSKSAWSLLIPPTLALLPADGFSRSVSELELRAQITSLKLALKMPGTKIEANLDSVLVPRESPIWCSEQYSTLAPEQEWTKCIQELLYHYHESSITGQVD